MNTTVARCVAELEAHLGRFTALSDDARHACSSGDSDALASALDARDAVTRQMAPLVAALDEQRQALSRPDAVAAFDAAMRPLQLAAMLAGQRNALLAAHAQSARTAIGESIGRLGHDSAAQSAYAAVAERDEASQLDFTR
ncbi:MAG: hypothetical protein IPF98_05825 [Gemmatimonadetes bacterium]|nr:hypothetical protein [Gemmatimonadota bacterium]